jgi:membrane protein insertase Oxa1/YidC/SpoIIIJ
MSTAISLYWITSSAFTILQNIIVKRSAKEWIHILLKEKILKN